MTGATERKHSRRQYGPREDMEETKKCVDFVGDVDDIVYDLKMRR